MTNEDNDNTTKLIILVMGISIVSLFAYLIYNKNQNNKIAIPSQSLQMMNQSKQIEISKIEQKLNSLENKLDNLSGITKILQTQPTLQMSERNIVSMGKSFQSQSTKSRTPLLNIKEIFGMR